MEEVGALLTDAGTGILMQVSLEEHEEKLCLAPRTIFDIFVSHVLQKKKYFSINHKSVDEFWHYFCGPPPLKQPVFVMGQGDTEELSEWGNWKSQPGRGFVKGVTMIFVTEQLMKHPSGTGWWQDAEEHFQNQVLCLPVRPERWGSD